jgi:ElaA protein
MSLDINTLRWQSSALDDFSPRQVYDIMGARSAVFVVEQSCIYKDADGYDYEAEHLVAWSGNTVAAYLRILAPDTAFDEPSLGRILTTEKFRGCGLGRLVVAKGLARLQTKYPGRDIRIGAQEHLENFYGEFGFRKASERYVEDGIPHIEMIINRAQTSPQGS